MRLRKIILLSFLVLGACSSKKADETPVADPVVVPVETAKPKYLYVSSGACYSGTNTTFTTATSSNQVFRLNIASGQKDMTFADYFSLPANPGDSPVHLVEADSSNLMVLVLPSQDLA